MTPPETTSKELTTAPEEMLTESTQEESTTEELTAEPTTLEEPTMEEIQTPETVDDTPSEITPLLEEAAPETPSEEPSAEDTTTPEPPPFGEPKPTVPKARKSDTFYKCLLRYGGRKVKVGSIRKSFPIWSDTEFDTAVSELAEIGKVKISTRDGTNYILPLQTDGTVLSKQSMRGARHLRSALRLISEQSESGFRELAGAVYRIAENFKDIDWNDEVFQTELTNWQ